MEQKEPNNTIRTNDSTPRDKSEGAGERRKIKKILTLDSKLDQYRQRRIIQTNKERMCEDMPIFTQPLRSGRI